MSSSPRELLDSNGETVNIDDAVVPSSSADKESNAGHDDDDSLSSGDDTTAIGDLQSFMENDSCLHPNEKTHYGITLCFAYIKDFSMDAPPYNHKIFDNNKRLHKPLLKFLKTEVKRRKPKAKGIQNKKMDELLQLLGSKDFELPNIDLVYLKKFLAAYEEACHNTINEQTCDLTGNAPQAAVSPRITTHDRLRLIEAFLSDKAKPKLASTQECLNRQQLDARNSVEAVEDYFETVSQVFNNPTFIPRSTALPDLHPELEKARDLPLLQYRTTRAKVKEKYDEMRGQLNGMIVKWELSGNGGHQRSEDADDFGHFDPEEVIDGDDKRNFLPNDAMYYLLYYWHRLDEEGFLQFTLAKLPESAKACSDHYSLVSAPARKKPKSDSGDKLSASIDSLTNQWKSSATAEVFDKNWDRVREMTEKILELDLKLIDLSPEDPKYKIIANAKVKYEDLLREAQSRMNNSSSK